MPRFQIREILMVVLGLCRQPCSLLIWNFADEHLTARRSRILRLEIAAVQLFFGTLPLELLLLLHCWHRACTSLGLEDIFVCISSPPTHSHDSADSPVSRERRVVLQFVVVVDDFDRFARLWLIARVFVRYCC
ncbi:unnamed protein product [Polarella glacialis]|uniref:Uncharacterized protein n=1 Tax=Polarella glacialis TaxID=89957 RepID=A0A813KLR2_POLGL|nr:unnamed protein product [Polarella glacialis]CAE8702583.1 unnamed protein product [Polarella glacialis]